MASEAGASGPVRIDSYEVRSPCGLRDALSAHSQDARSKVAEHRREANFPLRSRSMRERTA
jgi:hypothetical protein